MSFDHDILFEFIPEKDKKSFMVWDNVYEVPSLYIGTLSASSGVIVAVYRAPFEQKIVVTLKQYNARLKQKERGNKLNNLGI
jgi:hypothetical protein